MDEFKSLLEIGSRATDVDFVVVRSDFKAIRNDVPVQARANIFSGFEEVRLAFLVGGILERIERVVGAIRAHVEDDKILRIHSKPHGRTARSEARAKIIGDRIPIDLSELFIFKKLN
jgi:hypothetical protein